MLLLLDIIYCAFLRIYFPRQSSHFLRYQASRARVLSPSKITFARFFIDLLYFLRSSSFLLFFSEFIPHSCAFLEVSSEQSSSPFIVKDYIYFPRQITFLVIFTAPSPGIPQPSPHQARHAPRQRQPPRQPIAQS